MNRLIRSSRVLAVVCPLLLSLLVPVSPRASQNQPAQTPQPRRDAHV